MLHDKILLENIKWFSSSQKKKIIIGVPNSASILEMVNMHES